MDNGSWRDERLKMCLGRVGRVFPEENAGKWGKTGKIEKTSKNIDKIAQIGGKSRKRLGFPHISVFFGDFTCAFLQASLDFSRFSRFSWILFRKTRPTLLRLKMCLRKVGRVIFNYSYYFQEFVFRVACAVF